MKIQSIDYSEKQDRYWRRYEYCYEFSFLDDSYRLIFSFPCDLYSPESNEDCFLDSFMLNGFVSLNVKPKGQYFYKKNTDSTTAHCLKSIMIKGHYHFSLDTNTVCFFVDDRLKINKEKNQFMLMMIMGNIVKSITFEQFNKTTFIHAGL